MECLSPVVWALSCSLLAGSAAFALSQSRSQTPYGRYAPAGGRRLPARLAWFLQEVPAVLLPLLLLLRLEPEPETPGTGTGTGSGTGRTLLLCTFVLHYLHRSLVYSFMSRGSPVPVSIVIYAAIFCTGNGFLQGHHLLHCAHFPPTWTTHARLAAGFLVFVVGLAINIHSDQILIRLRRPGEVRYRIPRGGMFELVSGANFFGEILEWFGYALAAGTFPAFAFAVFTACSVGPRALHHHRDYHQRFQDYPASRKALIPFLL